MTGDPSSRYRRGQPEQTTLWPGVGDRP